MQATWNRVVWQKNGTLDSLHRNEATPEVFTEMRIRKHDRMFEAEIQDGGNGCTDCTE